MTAQPPATVDLLRHLPPGEDTRTYAQRQHDDDLLDAAAAQADDGISEGEMQARDRRAYGRHCDVWGADR